MEVLDKCPVCNLPLSFAPWSGDIASHEICPCCGTHFGYDDACSGNPQLRGSWYLERRRTWVAAGMPWHRKSSAPPTGWSGARQLAGA